MTIKSTLDRPVWVRILPYACLVGTVLMAALVPPPTKLVTFVGSDIWTRLALGLVSFMALFLVLIILGLAAGKVGLPFGLSLETGTAAMSSETTAALVAELAELRQADERLFVNIGELTTLLRQTLERLQDVERATDARQAGDVS